MKTSRSNHGARVICTSITFTLDAICKWPRCLKPSKASIWRIVSCGGTGAIITANIAGFLRCTMSIDAIRCCVVYFIKSWQGGGTRAWWLSSTYTMTHTGNVCSNITIYLTIIIFIIIIVILVTTCKIFRIIALSVINTSFFVSLIIMISAAVAFFPFISITRSEVCGYWCWSLFVLMTYEWFGFALRWLMMLWLPLLLRKLIIVHLSFFNFFFF